MFATSHVFATSSTKLYIRSLRVNKAAVNACPSMCSLLLLRLLAVVLAAQVPAGVGSSDLTLGTNIWCPDPGIIVTRKIFPSFGGMDDKQQQLERKRAAGRGWATRSSNALAALVAKPEVTIMELEDGIEDFDKRLAALDDAQSAVELGIVEPDKLEDDIKAADQFRRQVRVPRVQAAQKLAELLQKTVPQGNANSDGGAAESVLSNIRLPRIELPKFSGNVLEWLSFWEQFEALVGEANIPAISKFGYLHSSLEGEAKRVLQGLTLTAVNYPIACRMLKERFGKSERIIFAHIQALLNIDMPVKSSGSKYIASLWKMQDQLNSHVRSLEALGVKGDQYGVILTPVILSRLPQEIRMEWSRDGSGHEGDLD